MCIPLWGACFGPSVGESHPCCSPALNCVQQNEYYGQCRPVDMPTPDDWAGNVIAFTPADTSSGETEVVATTSIKVGTVATPGKATCDNDYDEEYVQLTSDDQELVNLAVKPLLEGPEESDADSASICAPDYGQCHGVRLEDRRICCSAALFCVVKDEYYGQCLPAGQLPRGWEGTIVDYRAVRVPAKLARASQPFANTGVDANVAAVPPPTTGTPSTPAPVTGDDTEQCTATYQQCGGVCDSVGCTSKCCSASDHCIMESTFYAQCLPKNRAIPSDWIGTVIA